METKTLILNGPDTAFSAALTLASNWTWPKERNGKPCHYFWKEALPVVTNKRDSKGNVFSVPPERIDSAIRDFRLARSKGHEPSIPSSHNTATAKNYGWIVDARKNAKGGLELLHQFVGDAEKEDALNRKTSICLLSNFTDADGTRYENFIDHNAAVTNPQLFDLSDFQPALAAARGQPAGEVVTVTLAAEPPIERRSEMDLTQLRKALGLAEDAPDADVISSATAKLAAVPALETDKATALSRVTAVEAERDAAKAQVLELSRTGNGPDPEVLHERSLRIMDKADSLSAAGILPPAFVDKFKKLLGGDKPRALLLSRDTGAADCPAGEFINLLAEFKPVMQFGEKTGAQQTLALGRQAYGNAGEAGADEEAKKIDEFMKERQAQRKTA
jgi:hypothetical protein